MATVDTLLVQIKADMTDLNRKLKRVERQVDTSSKKMTRSLGTVAKFAKIGFAVVVGSQLLRGAKSIVDFAGSMEEMRAKAQVVFGEFFTQVQGQFKKLPRPDLGDHVFIGAEVTKNMSLGMLTRSMCNTIL